MTTAVGTIAKACSTVALLTLLILAPMAQGEGIFLPVVGADAPSDAAISGMNRPVRDAFEPRMVRVTHAELEKARDQAAHSGTGSLLFNLPGLYLRGVIERTASTLGGYSLSGRIDGRGGGFMTLAVHDGAVVGSVWTPEASYEILPRGSGLHVVRQASTAHRCAGPIVGGRTSFHASPLAQTTSDMDDDLNTIVDVLVVWTPEREAQAGGEANVRAEIDMWVAYANDAFERSGAFVALNLVGAERVDYVEADTSTDLERLAESYDGYMDEVHDRRDALNADLVSLSIARGSGLARLGGAFSVTGPFARTFTHEIGHNFGLVHDHYASHATGHQYNVGRVVLDRRCVTTIMAYGAQCLHAGYPDSPEFYVPYFSSPSRSDPSGSPLGVWRFSNIRTTNGPADAVAMINRNRHAVGSFRP